MSYFSVQKKICTLNWDFTTPGMKSYFSVQNLFSELGLGLGLGLPMGNGGREHTGSFSLLLVAQQNQDSKYKFR